MSIKDQLRAAILSGGMTGAAPSTSISITLADNTKNFVPPCDGYLHFRGELDSTDKWLSLFQYDYGRSYDNTGSAPLEDLVRVRKGAPVAFNCKEGMLIKKLKFFKCVGGGAKIPVAQSIWRAVPCLRSTSRRFLNKPLRSRSLQVTMESVWMYRLARKLRSLARAMAWSSSLSKALPQALGSAFTREVESLSTTTRVTTRWLRSLLKRDVPLSVTQVRALRHTLCSPLVKRTDNFVLGGLS